MASGKIQLHNNRGFTLVEVVIADWPADRGVARCRPAVRGVDARQPVGTHVARRRTTMAEQKMEQIRSLTWGFDTAGQGLPVSDTTTNLAVYPFTSSGTGLNPSPADSLEQNVTGCFDYVNSAGVWVGTGATPPGTAAYLRRWAITPLPTNPNNTLVIQVLVTPLANEQARTSSQFTRTRMSGDSLLVSVKTRKAS